jgi:hypothetical protein
MVTKPATPRILNDKIEFMDVLASPNSKKGWVFNGSSGCLAPVFGSMATEREFSVRFAHFGLNETRFWNLLAAMRLDYRRSRSADASERTR